MTRGIKRTLSAVALTAVVGATTWVLADAASDALKAAPAPVQATVKSLVGENKMAELSQEMSDGKPIYDLEFSIKGTSYAADIDPSGAILQREVDIDAVMVPPKVMNAAKKAHSDGTVAETAIAQNGDILFYDLEMKVGKDTHELEISAGGKMLKDTILPPEAPATPAAPAAPK